MIAQGWTKNEFCVVFVTCTDIKLKHLVQVIQVLMKSAANMTIVLSSTLLHFQSHDPKKSRANAQKQNKEVFFSQNVLSALY